MARHEYPLPPHGTRARYAGSRTRPPCRCAACTEVNTHYQARYRHQVNPWQRRLL